MSDATQVVFPLQGEAASWIFWCEGCECVHGIDSRWQFDGDLHHPTISPSILAIGEKRCHSFVTRGEIRYLSDSEHHLAGQTVPLRRPPWEDTDG